jgi:hypothetical protein
MFAELMAFRVSASGNSKKTIGTCYIWHIYLIIVSGSRIFRRLGSKQKWQLYLNQIMTLNSP